MMLDDDIDQEPKRLSRAMLRERRRSARRVYLDPSTPPVRSIVRVVLITLVLLFIAGYVQSIISSLGYLFFLIILSVFFAYLMDPLVRFIREPFKSRDLGQWMPRPVAIIIAYALVFSVLGISISLIAPRLGDQAKEFGANLPALGQAIRLRANDLNRRFDRLRIPDEVQAEMNKQVTDLGASITAGVGNFLLMSIAYLPWLLLIPILAFFFLKDVNLFRLSVLRIFPAGRWRYRAEIVMADVHSTLTAYTRAQMLSCILIAILCTAGFWALGMRYALLMGILAGIFEFVPLLGPLTIGLIAVITAAASDDPWRALYVAIFLITLRVIHDYLTYPRIVRGGVHLHPLAIILSVLAGEQIAGIPGVFVSIPLVAVATVIYRHALEHQGAPGFIKEMIEDGEMPKAPEEAV